MDNFEGEAVAKLNVSFKHSPFAELALDVAVDVEQGYFLAVVVSLGEVVHGGSTAAGLVPDGV